MSNDLGSTDLQPRSEQDGEIVADTIAPVDVWETYLDTLGAVVDEAGIHFNDEGVTSTVVDPANAAMSDLSLSAANFESYDAGAVTVGVYLSRFADAIGLGNAGDLARVRVDMESRKLWVDVGDRYHQRIALIDPDSIRKEPDIPDDLELPNAPVVEAADFADALDAVELVTDHVKLGWDGERELFVVQGLGDVDETHVEFGYDDLVGGEFHEATASLFSHDYMDKLTSVIPSDAEVEIEFGEDVPAKLHYSALEGHLNVTAICAPRIKSE